MARAKPSGSVRRSRIDKAGRAGSAMCSKLRRFAPPLNVLTPRLRFWAERRASIGGATHVLLWTAFLARRKRPALSFQMRSDQEGPAAGGRWRDLYFR